MAILKSRKKLFSHLGIGRNADLIPVIGLQVHALHKSASMFLYRFFCELCAEYRIPLYSIHNQPANEQAAPANVSTAHVICPIRSFPQSPLPGTPGDEHRYLLQVRDPRDVLVSEYYSLGWLHSDQGWDESARRRRQEIQQSSIDEFVLEERLTGKPPLLERMQNLPRLSRDPRVTVVTYEQMVTDFAGWLEAALAPLGLEDDQRLQRRLMRRYDGEFQPDPSGGHKRNVTPGDHRNKLLPTTIAQLNDRFGALLECCGYQV